MKRFTLCILSACLLTGGTIVGAESESLFSKDAVVPVELRIDPDGIGALRQNPREYVRGRIRRDTNMLTEVEVRLKGNDELSIDRSESKFFAETRTFKRCLTRV